MAEDDKTAPQQGGKRADEGKPIDWDHELPAWETSFPLDEATPAGGSGDDLADLEQSLPDLGASLELSEVDPHGEAPTGPGGDLTDDRLALLARTRQNEAPTPAGGVAYDEAPEPTDVTTAPGMTPAAPTRPEDDSSSVLIIPDVAELEAASTAPRAWSPFRGRHPPDQPAAPPPTEVSPEAPPVASTAPDATGPTEGGEGRGLTADGLPDLSELFSDPTPTLPLPGTADWQASETPSSGGSDPFAEPLPEEQTPTLDLQLPSRSWIWSPDAVAAEVAVAGDGAASLGPAYWRGQLGQAMDELAAVEADEEFSAERRARRAFAVGRIAARAGGEGALPFHQRAREADETFLPALRGELRALAEAAPLAGERRAGEALQRLAARFPLDGEAYAELAAELLALTAPGESTPVEGGAEPPSLAALLRAAERAVPGNDVAGTGRALAALSSRLPEAAGQAMAVVAALFLERAGQLAEAQQLRLGGGEGGSLAGAMAELRRTARGEPEGTGDPQGATAGAPWQRLLAAAESLPPSPVRAAILRWAARCLPASAGGADTEDVPSAETLLARARQDAGLEEGDLREQMAMATALLGEAARSSAADVEAAWRAVPGDLTPVVLRRLFAPGVDLSADGARALLEGGRAWMELASSPASTTAAGLEDPHRRVPLLGILAERLTTLGEAPQRLAALRAWAVADPGRRASAQRKAAALLLALDPPDLEAAAEATAAAASAAPGDASFWSLSWHERRAGQSDRASASLRRGVAGYAAPGAGGESLAQALEDRAAQLEVAAHPERLLQRLPVTSFAAGDQADDPAALARALEGEVTDVRKLAERWKQAAANGSAFRALEAAGWLREAGLPGEALALLLEVDARGEEHPQVALMQRRLVGLAGEPAVQARVLGDWLAAVTNPAERAELELLRAEALERAGAQREAAGIYRELLAGPLLRDADLALRRALWSLRDGAALEELWRDEHDAMSGAGRARQAAAALVEKARVARDLRGDMEGAADELRAALDEDSTRQEARVMLLAMAEGRLARGAGVGRLGELARELGEHAPSMLQAIALLAEGQGPAEAELGGRLLQESVDRSAGQVPLALLRRQVVALEARDPPAPESRAILQAAADSLVARGHADPRLASALWLRAAELAEADGDGALGEALIDRARALEPQHLPPLVRKGRLLMARGADAEAAEVLAELGRALRGPGRARALRAAAALVFARLQDRPRAQALLDEALTLDPRDEVAFAWLRRLLEAEGDSAGLATLLGRRAAVSNGVEAAALRLARADLLLGPLSDRPAARAELGAVLVGDPQNVAALARLAGLEQEEGNLGAAAALSIRQARFERDPEALRDCFLRIGRLHTGPLEDPKLALGAYERVLRIEPSHREALEALSELYARQAETRKALSVTERLVEMEPDPTGRLPYIIKLASLWEAAGDARRAGVVYRRAVDELPRDLNALGELARFHERQGDNSARNVLLDGSLALLRDDLRRSPIDLPTLRTIIPLLRWRQRRATAKAATQLLARFSDSETERAEAVTFLGTLRSGGSSPAAGSRLAPLANPELDERALPGNLQAGVRHVLRLLGPGLARSAKPDLRRFQVGRGQRQGRGTPLRELLTPLAADLGVRELDLYVSAAQPMAMVVEPGDPPAIILGAKLVEMGAPALRFAAGFLLRLIETHFDLLVQGGPAEAGALMAAVARQFLPDFRPSPPPEPARLAVAEARVGRALNKSLRTELGPFASQIAGALDPEALHLAALETGARAGLLASGDLGSALEVIARISGHSGPGPATPETLRQLPLATGLCDFALSEDYEELSQSLDTVS